ncbi:MAG: NPCBM/NEW2 domain-containing protein [Defluviitaleaceae bacterium]|nr:NPCBM/NEW2 domain-containing protein [Defluviitaleaceae bacterium]
MNKERIKGGAIGFILCLLLSASVMPVIAQTATRPVIYGVRVNLNGQLLDFAPDSRPFVSGGRTFLPLRDLAETLGLPVDFDIATNTVYLGDRFAVQPRPRTSLRHAAPFFDRNTDNIRFDDTVTMSGVTYNNPLIFRRSSSAAAGVHFSLHNLNGQYRIFSGYMGRADGADMRNATVNILGDGVVLESFDLRATDMPTPFSVFVEGVHQLRIEVRFTGNGITRYAIVGYLE